MTPNSEPELAGEVPGGARRADTFLLVIATVIALGVVAGFAHEHPPVMPLFGAAMWLQFFARWLRHVRPASVRTIESLAAAALGAALYAGLAGR